VSTAGAAALYFSGLGLSLQLLERLGVDVAGSGWLTGFAILAVFGGPFVFGYWVTERIGAGRPWPVALGALTGAAAVFIVPTVITVWFDPDGGPAAAAVAAILAAIGAWCVAVATGAGAFLAMRRR
jgi:hypothetical protein